MEITCVLTYIFVIKFYTCHGRLQHHLQNYSVVEKSVFHKLVKGDTILRHSANAFAVLHQPIEVIDDLGCQVMVVLFGGTSTDSIARILLSASEW